MLSALLKLSRLPYTYLPYFYSASRASAISRRVGADSTMSLTSSIACLSEEKNARTRESYCEPSRFVLGMTKQIYTSAAVRNVPHYTANNPVGRD